MGSGCVGVVIGEVGIVDGEVVGVVDVVVVEVLGDVDVVDAADPSSTIL